MKTPKIVSYITMDIEQQKSWFFKYTDIDKVAFIVEDCHSTEDEVCKAVSGSTLILASPLTPFLNRKILEAAKGVKLVKFVSVGYDRIDLKAAKDLGIPVANNAGVNAVTVAEHAMMMILALQRKACVMHDEVMNGQWPVYIPGDLWELRGRTLGILGLGAIGTELAKISKGFGVRILYNKRNRLCREIENELSVEYRNFETLLKESDVLSVHVPLYDETYHMIGVDEIRMMKDNAIIVNTARRDVVDEMALSKALRSGKLYGVGIDVPKTGENRAEDLKELFQGCNAIITSHIASNSGQIMGRFVERISECIRRVLEDEPPLYLVSI
jgi:glyoxylate reductase/D-3-phosphoglycerate dehydrogenase